LLLLLLDLRHTSKDLTKLKAHSMTYRKNLTLTGPSPKMKELKTIWKRYLLRLKTYVKLLKARILLARLRRPLRKHSLSYLM
jgi:hypothetical protein